ncbi:hypothetical protein FRC07_011815 [Ceratobasidium sp. 392]|nr:hypothetical protein FRC07_011815 [Ceratobasidium sp. 392]
MMHIWSLAEPGARLMVDQLRELVVRYSFVCTSHEDFVVHKQWIVLYRARLERPIRYAHMDRNDLVVTVSCFTSKLVPPKLCIGAPKPIPLEFATVLLAEMLFNIQTTDYAPELSFPLLKAGFTRLWMDLSTVPEDESVKWVDIVPYTFQLLKIIRYNLILENQASFRRAVTAFPILSVILEADLVDILGRLCLIPFLFKTIPAGVETGVTVTLENQKWTDQLEVIELLDAISILPRDYVRCYMKPEFSPYQPD